MKFRFLFALLGTALFSLTANAIAPFITGFNRPFGSSNDPTPILIYGGGFSNVSLVVRFNGVLALNSFATAADGSTISAQIRPGTLSGTAPVVVSVNGQQAPTNNGVVFSVIGPNDPYVTGFSPTFGNPGQSVTITGTHFTGASVRFNGTGANISVNNDNQITATVPNGASTGPISVQKATTFTTGNSFFVSPTITSFSPSSGRAGTSVTIRGNSFSNAFAVKFGNLNAMSFNVDSNSQITAIAPNNVLTGQIRVEAPGGTNITSTNFTVAPTITGFNPAYGTATTNVTITGANFNVGTPTVKFGGVTAASVSGVTFNSLNAVVPSGATNALITVTTTDGSGTSTQVFYIKPTLSSFTPTNGGAGTTVRITGNNFSAGAPGTGATAVNFNGKPASSFFVTNNTTIGAVVPDGVITGPVSVTTPAGTANSTGFFFGPPMITSFTPLQGANGTNVTIFGTNLFGALAVLFNGTNAPNFTATDNGFINVVVPPNATTGPITVIAPGGTNTSQETFIVIYSSDLLILVSDLPDPVFVGSNLVYTLTIGNNGPYPAPNVMLTNKLPDSVNLKSAVASQGTLNTNQNPIIAAFGTITNTKVATVTLTVVPQSAGWITNVATIGSDNIDPTRADHTNTVSTLVWPLPVLSIQNLSSDQVKVFWPAPLSNFFLLFKTNLVAPTWNTDLTARVISGTNISVTETSSNAAKFYRLRQ